MKHQCKLVLRSAQLRISKHGVDAAGEELRMRSGLSSIRPFDGLRGIDVLMHFEYVEMQVLPRAGLSRASALGAHASVL